MIPTKGYIVMNATTLKPPVGQAEKPAVQTSSGPDLPCVRSDDLFGKDREIKIEHSGAYYRLRLTRANKLILTK